MSLLPADLVLTGYVIPFAYVSTHTQGYLSERHFLSIKIHINRYCTVPVFPKF